MSHGVWSRNRLIRDAIYRAIEEKMRVNDRVYLCGEGAYMKIHYDAISIDRFAPHHIITLPISEDTNTNFAVGLALGGLVPVVDVITSDFLFRTMDAICNTIPKQNFASGTPKTIVIRAEFMAGGPTTGQRIESLFTHIPGLFVVVPSNPRDAYGLMLSALERRGATLFFEDRMIDDETTTDPFAAGDTAISLGKGYVRKGGGRLTVVSYGLTLRRCDALLKDLPVELIDLRTLYPLDVETVWRSVSRTGGLLVVEPDIVHGGVGAELIAQIYERFSGNTRESIKCSRIGAPRATLPASTALHARYQPSDEEILARVREMSS